MKKDCGSAASMKSAQQLEDSFSIVLDTTGFINLAEAK